MSYEESCSLLSCVNPNPYTYNGLYLALIIPEIVDERRGFIDDLQNNKISKKDVVNYSSNGHFTVNGFKAKTFNL